jgi:hypothetical protein
LKEMHVDPVTTSLVCATRSSEQRSEDSIEEG